MYRKTQTAALLLGLLLVLGSSPAVNSTFIPNPDSLEYKQLVEARRLNGLDISLDTINRLYAEQGPNPEFSMVGERDILGQHKNYEDEIPGLTSSLPEEHYAGVYMKSAENKIVILLVNSTPEMRENIVKQAKFPDSIEFEEVQFTKLSLNNARNVIEMNMNAIPNLTSIGVDYMHNRLSLGFNISEQETLASRKQIEQLIDPRLIDYLYDLKITLV